jgi:hypothetical protein
MRLMGFVAGVAVGYVLGTRDGRQRYDQLLAGARNLAALAWTPQVSQRSALEAWPDDVVTLAAPINAAKPRTPAKPRATTATRKSGSAPVPTSAVAKRTPAAKKTAAATTAPPAQIDADARPAPKKRTAPRRKLGGTDQS